MVKSIIKKTLFVGATLSLLSATPSFAFSLPQGISINGISLEGFTLDEAKDVLDNEIKKIEKTNVYINLDGKEIETNYLDLGFEFSGKENISSELESYVNSNVIKRFILQEELSSLSKDYSIDINVKKEKLKEVLADELGKLVSEPINANIKRENGKFIIKEGVVGKDIDLEKTFNDLKEKINNKGNDINIDASILIKEPTIKADDLKKIKTIIGTYTTSYGSSSYERATNIAVGSGKINGTLLMPGETLSGYELMHPFTISNGYKTAGAYSNGRVIDSVGGGVCQIATTLYNAALRAELNITQRNNHSMTVGYVPASCDAAIAGTTKDLKFMNNQKSPIFVEAIIAGRQLTFNIWGEETRAANRTIEFIPEVISQGGIVTTYIDDPNLPIGKEEKRENGHAPRKSKLWKVVKVNGKEVERSLISNDNYIASNDIVARGTGLITESHENSEVNNVGEPVLSKKSEATLIEGPGAVINED